jgi:3,4-dihydroxy-2-butanone 4-phosphate synthase
MEDALAAFAAGEFLVVMDDENRENEGDLIIAASQCTTEKMAWMIKHTRCVESASVTRHPSFDPTRVSFLLIQYY